MYGNDCERGNSADKLHMPRFARNWLKSAECVLVRVFLHKFLLGNFSCLSYRDPKNKHGVLGGDKIKTTKMKEIQRKWKNDSGACHDAILTDLTSYVI